MSDLVSQIPDPQVGGDTSGMRMVTVNSPLGTHTAYVPMSMSPEDAYAAVQEFVIPQIKAQQAKAAQSAAESNASQNDVLGIPGSGKYVTAAGQGFNDLIQGVKQMAGFGGPEQDADMATGQKAMAPLYASSPSAAIGRVVGGAAPVAAASLALTPAAAVATPIASLLNAIGQGGASGALPYVPPGGSRLGNAASGAMLGGAMQTPFSMLQKLAAGPTNFLSPTQASAVSDLQNIPGYSALPSQLTGNPSLRNLERVAGFMPLSSGQMAARQASNESAVTGAGLKILGAPEGATAGTPDVLAATKKTATDVMDTVQDMGVPIQIGDDHAAALADIRDQALNANTPNKALASTIDRLIGQPGQISPDTMVGGRRFGDLSPDQQAALGPQLAGSTGTPPKFPDGIPPDYYQSVTSDLSSWSKDGDYLSGKANKVLQQAAIDSLPGDLGTQLQQAKQQYGALMTADGAFNANGELMTHKLASALSGDSNQNVFQYGQTSNPRLSDLADLARAGRAAPQPPESGSQTASNMLWQKLMGMATEGVGAAGAAVGLHGAGGGGTSPGAMAAGGIGALLPFLLANYGTKAYLSAPVAKYAQQGIPSLADILSSLGPAGGAAVAGTAGALGGRP